MCAAMNVHPENKYQRHGGPGIKAIMELLSGSSAPAKDRANFLRACALNYVIQGTDAHAKNYSILLSADGTYRLAPLYDIISALPYAGAGYEKMAMSVNRKVKFRTIYPSDWESEAKKYGYDGEQALSYVRFMISNVADAAVTVMKKCEKEGLRTKTLSKLVDLIAGNAKKLAKTYK